MTPTVGAIAAQGEIYYPKGLPSVYLVTAKIRGGNSGGPVINKEGMVVAVATGISAGEGLSDDNIGYGMAYPIQCVETMMFEKNMRLSLLLSSQNKDNDCNDIFSICKILDALVIYIGKMVCYQYDGVLMLLEEYNLKILT